MQKDFTTQLSCYSVETFTNTVRACHLANEYSGCVNDIEWQWQKSTAAIDAVQVKIRINTGRFARFLFNVIYLSLNKYSRSRSYIFLTLLCRKLSCHGCHVLGRFYLEEPPSSQENCSSSFNVMLQQALFVVGF